MKARIYVCGEYQGEQEIGEDSLVEALIRGDAEALARRTKLLKEDLEKHAAKVKVSEND